MPTAQSILSDNEYELLKTEARNNKLTISQYLREVLTEQGIVKRKGLNVIPSQIIRTEEERLQEQPIEKIEYKLPVDTIEPDIDLDTENPGRLEDFNILNEKIEMLKSETDELNSNFNEYKNDFEMLKQNIDELKNGFNLLKTRMEALIDEFNEVKPITHEKVIDYIENHRDELITFIKIVKIKQMT